jgi:hypothetical protein
MPFTSSSDPQPPIDPTETIPTLATKTTLDFFVTAKWVEYPDPRWVPRGVALNNVYVTKMTRIVVDANDLVRDVADRICAILVPRNGRARTLGPTRFRQEMNMRLKHAQRVCDEEKPIKEYYVRQLPYLELEVVGV